MYEKGKKHIGRYKLTNTNTPLLQAEIRADTVVRHDEPSSSC